MGKYLDILATLEGNETCDRSDKGDKSEKSNTCARQKCDEGCDESLSLQTGVNLSSPYVATSVAANPLNYNLCRFGRFGRTLSELERRCPDLVDLCRWRQAVNDGKRFLIQWGEQAQALHWTPRDLFGLHDVPANPHPTYQRLSRYDCAGLIWLLQGCPVVALTQATAAIKMPTGTITTYRKHKLCAASDAPREKESGECVMRNRRLRATAGSNGRLN
jgi:hypothetical protein